MEKKGFKNFYPIYPALNGVFLISLYMGEDLKVGYRAILSREQSQSERVRLSHCLMDRLYDINQLSDLLQVKVSTIYSWVFYSRIPHKKLGKLLRFDEKEITEWVNKNSFKEEKKIQS